MKCSVGYIAAPWYLVSSFSSLCVGIYVCMYYVCAPVKVLTHCTHTAISIAAVAVVMSLVLPILLMIYTIDVENGIFAKEIVRKEMKKGERKKKE